MEIALAVTFIGLLVFLAHLFSDLFRTTRIPDVLPLLLIGVLLGPVFHVVPQEAFGRLGGAFTAIALVVILFESGTGLKFSELREALLPGMLLTLASFIAAVALIAGVAALLLHLDVGESLVLGATLGGTSSAVVIPMAAKLRLREHTRLMLLLESAFTDVLCIVITLALLQAIVAHELAPASMLRRVAAGFLLAAAIGAAAALVWALVLRTVRRLETSMFLTPAFAIIIYGLSELAGSNGAIAALAFGVVLGNARPHRWRLPFLHRDVAPRLSTLNRTEKEFMREIVFLLKTFFFVYMGLSIRLTSPMLLLMGLLLTVAIFLLRVPIARLVLGKTTPRFDATVVSIMVPRGLAAAVLASMPLEAGLPSGALIQNIVYAVVLFSVCLTAVLAFLAEKNLLHGPYALAFSAFAPDQIDEPHEPAGKPPSRSDTVPSGDAPSPP